MESKTLNIDQYLQAEEIGRQKAIKLLGDKATLVEPEDRYAPFDFSGSTITKNFYIEVKNRDCKSTSYTEDLLEYGKAKAMKNIEPNANRYFLNFFTDGVARLYHLNKLRFEDLFIENKLCPASSSEDKGEQMKICYLIPTDLAKTYTL